MSSWNVKSAIIPYQIMCATEIPHRRKSIYLFIKIDSKKGVDKAHIKWKTIY